MMEIKWKYNNKSCEYIAQGKNHKHCISKDYDGYIYWHGHHFIGTFEKLKSAKQCAELIEFG